jgi:hypothetical protein
MNLLQSLENLPMTPANLSQELNQSRIAMLLVLKASSPLLALKGIRAQRGLIVPVDLLAPAKTIIYLDLLVMPPCTVT